MKFTIKDIQQFLKSQGINWNGYYAHYDLDQTRGQVYTFKKVETVEDIMRNRLLSLLLTGSKEDVVANGGTIANNGLMIRSCNNPSVLATSISPVEFKIYSIKESKSDEMDDVETEPKEVKDLTMRWAEYLGSVYPEYINFISSYGERKKVEAREKWKAVSEKYDKADAYHIYVAVANRYNDMLENAWKGRMSTPHTQD